MFERLRSYFTGETYQARAFRGAAATIVTHVGQNALRLAGNLVLTRILFPEAFGLMALVQVVLGGAAMFSDIGIRGSIVQSKRGEEETFLNTAWTVQIARGLLIGALVAALSGPIARFYDEPLLADLLLFCAAVPVIRGFTSTKLLLASRKLQLVRASAIELVGQLVGLGVVIALALWLQSVWALAIGTIFSTTVVAVLSHLVLAGPSNRLATDRAAIRSLFIFGRFVFLATIASFFVNQGSKAVLGKFVTLEELSFYTIALMFATIPLVASQTISDKVMHPLYARRPPADSVSNRRKLNKARSLLTGGAIAVVAATVLIGDPLVRFLYDPRYHSAGPMLSLVALASLPALIGATYRKLPMAAGHSGRYAVYEITNGFVLFGLLLILVPPYGVLGAIVAPAIGTIVVYPLLIWVIAPYKGWDPLHDAFYAAASVLVAALGIWTNWPILKPLFQGG